MIINNQHIDSDSNTILMPDFNFQSRIQFKKIPRNKECDLYELSFSYGSGESIIYRNIEHCISRGIDLEENDIG